MSSRSSGLVFEHSKCSNESHLEQTPTAALLLVFKPGYLHDLDTHLASDDAMLASLFLDLDLSDFLESTFFKSIHLISAFIASRSAISSNSFFWYAVSHQGRKKVSTKYRDIDLLELILVVASTPRG